MRVVLVVVVIVAVVAQAAYLRWSHPDERVMFEAAFGISPPEGVRDLTAHRKNVGILGDSATFLRFNASASTVDQIVGERELLTDQEYAVFHFEGGGDLCGLWESAFDGYIEMGGPDWVCPSSFPDPMIFEWQHIERDVLMTVSMLWSTGTGEAYVLLLEG